MNFRLVSYNIHKGIGGIDRRYRPERIIEVLAHYKPDIALLQEVDDGVARSQHHMQAQMLAEALEYPHHGYQRNARVRTGHYGNAILSRFPVTATADIDLTWKFKKRRAALVSTVALDIDGHQRSVVIANVHLGLAEFERRLQLMRLLNHDSLSHRHTDTPMIIAGDYNDVWAKIGRRTLEPAGFQLAGRGVRTFPARLPIRPLDRVYYRGNIQATHCHAGHCVGARTASDHLPLVVDFQLTA